MRTRKLSSFTLSEMLVVLIITAIVVGIGFSVLRLVQREVGGIQKNLEKTSELHLFEQRLSIDLDRHPLAFYHSPMLTLVSETDTIRYTFTDSFLLRQSDTIKLRVAPEKIYYNGKIVPNGICDAIKLSAVKEVPDFYIFVQTSPDAAHYINRENGF